MFIQILNHINNFNEMCMNSITSFVHLFNVPKFLIDPIAESINLIPFLFFIFVIIEIIENYFSEKIESLSLNSRKFGPLIGSILASIPQCGFSVIATMLYIKKYITLGTLLAVYLATSDEAIPILLVHPERVSIIMPILLIKITIGIICGYLIDFIIRPQVQEKLNHVEVDESGCCHNKIHSTIKTLFIHPIKHTFNIFVFILIINCCLSFCLTYFNSTLNALFNTNQYTQIFLSSLVGLIPNCGASVLIIMLYLKNILNFGALISGLSTNAGLGLLVLFKNNSSIKNSLFILTILLVISCFFGLLIMLLS